MVVNVDHLCPGCAGAGCNTCKGSGSVRAPADQAVAPVLDIETANRALNDFKSGKWKYAGDVVKDLRSGIPQAEVDSALEIWLESKEANHLEGTTYFENGPIMDRAFEAGYRAGRAK